MKLRQFFTAVCWFAGITWASVQWTGRKARRGEFPFPQSLYSPLTTIVQVQVTEIRRAAADGYMSIKRRATEVMRPSAPTPGQITHQRRAQPASRQLPRNLRRASTKLRSRISPTEHTVSHITTGDQPMAPLTPPASPLMAAVSILDTQEPTIYRPKSLDEMIALENAKKGIALKNAQAQEEEEKSQKKAQELARKKSRQMARVKVQERAKKAERLVLEMARSTAQQQARPTEKLARPMVRMMSPQSSEDEAEIPAQQLAQTIGKQQANKAGKLAQQTVRSILKRNHQQEAQDEPLPLIQAPEAPSKEDQKARDESYIDWFQMPEVYEEEKVLEAGVEGGLKNLALESSSEHIDRKTEEDERRKKVLEDYTRLAAEELARAQAEAEKLARELQEEEAAREPHTGRRRLQTKLVELNEDWHIKINQAMSKGANVTLATTLDGTQLTKNDFGTVLGQCSWLNDNIINSYVDMVVEHANKKAGRNQRDKTPKVVAQNSFFYSNISKNGPQSVSRWMRRKRAAGEKLLEVETMLIPVNNASHWTMIVVSPKARTIEYLDSFGGSKDVFIRNTKAWLAVELGSLWNEDDWRVLDTNSARQYNGYDCGVFAITNAECVAGGVTTTSYDGDDMFLQRRRIAAVLLNGGFGGDLEAAEDI